MKININPFRTHKMKKIVLLLLLFTGMVKAQIVINNPTPYYLCDIDNNSEAFVFDVKKAEILGALDPLIYNLKYYNTLLDSQLNINAYSNGAGNATSVNTNTTFYIRVYETNNPSNYALTSLDVFLIPTPYANSTTYMLQPDIPFDGHSSFDLTSKSSLILGNQLNCNVTYYTNLYDAQNGTNPILNDTNYTNTTNPQIIYAKVTNAVGCSTITNFNLVLSNPDILTIPDYNLKYTLINMYSLDYNWAWDGPLPNAKDSSGNTITIDANNDGEIQVVEALNVYQLTIERYLNQNITDSSGIEMFTNLTKLDLAGYNLSNLNFNSLTNLTDLKCFKCNLTTLNLSSLTDLVSLDCHQNQLTSLNINGLTNLMSLDCSTNNLSTLDLSTNINLVNLNFELNGISTINLVNNTNLEKLNCHYNQITTLNISTQPNLKELYCNHNMITVINFNPISNLIELDCSSNQITNLNVIPFTNLELLNCSTNQIANLNLSGLTNLTSLVCEANLLTNLDISDLTNLVLLKFSNNSIPSIDFSVVPNLEYLHCSSNPISLLSVSVLTNLRELYCKNLLINNLDLSNNRVLQNLMAQDNSLLQYINLKNGFDNANNIFYSYAPFIGNNPFTNCPNLLYICLNNDAENVKADLYLNQANLINTQASSYCSFTPGGLFNTISGTTIFDAYANGCDENDILHPFIKVTINDDINQEAVFLNTSGNYLFFTQEGSYTITPEMENPAYFNISPENAVITFANNNNNAATQNFCITPNGIHNDLEIVIAPITPARPGFDATYSITYKNKGNQVLSGIIRFSYDDTILDFISSTPNPDIESDGLLSYEYQNLLPFESRNFTLTLNVNSPVEIPAVNIGDILILNASISPFVGEEILFDNTFTYNQTVVGSFDPNNIECLEGNTVPASLIGNYLHYVINFENTGTFQAENIVVKTTIDATKYDVNSLQMLNTSHNSYIRQNGNVIEFIFENIALDTGGHGNILFKIKTLDNLVTGNMVSKRADIFFDYNAPVDTGLVNTVFSSLNNGTFTIDESISVYPNPTKNNININSNFNIKSVQLFDIQGRLLQTQLVNEVHTILDISEKANGVYFIKITSDKGSKIEKLVKE